MILGRVVGTVWATRKHPQLDAHKLVLVRPYFYYNPPNDAEQLVAVDLVDAGVGDDVVVCLGAPARWSLGGENQPADAAILGIVDRCQLSRAAFAPPTGPLTSRGPIGQQQGRLRFIGEQEPRDLEWLP